MGIEQCATVVEAGQVGAIGSASETRGCQDMDGIVVSPHPGSDARGAVRPHISPKIDVLFAFTLLGSMIKRSDLEFIYDLWIIQVQYIFKILTNFHQSHEMMIIRHFGGVVNARAC